MFLIQELKPQNLLSLEVPLRDDKRIASVQSRITYIIKKMLLAYYMEDTKVKKIMVEPS